MIANTTLTSLFDLPEAEHCELWSPVTGNSQFVLHRTILISNDQYLYSSNGQFKLLQMPMYKSTRQLDVPYIITDTETMAGETEAFMQTGQIPRETMDGLKDFALVMTIAMVPLLMNTKR